jgi:hypothetical protein
MKKLLTAALLTAALIPAASFAFFKTGNTLLAECTNKGTEIVDFMDKSSCNAYIMGFEDTHKASVLSGLLKPLFCSPGGATVKQRIKIVVKYLNENPEGLHYPASALVSNVLNEAFPPSFKADGTRYCPE